MWKPLLLCIFLSQSEAWLSSSKKWTQPTCLSLATPIDDDGCIRIRNADYAELNAVSDIVLQSFYERNIHKGPWKRVYKLAELNRLQQNFPYQDTDLHQMLVAIDDESHKVVGFVDVDARPCKTKIKLPRPYLSDLCVDPDFRRRGIANRLVRACEQFTQDIPRTELWIRVKEDNAAAVEMYKSMNYMIEGNDEKEPEIIVLHKNFAAVGGENKERQDTNASSLSKSS